MQITVNIDNTDLNTVIGEKRTYDEDGDYIGTDGLTLADEVVTELVKTLKASDGYQTLTGRVAEIRAEMIRERLKPAIDAAFDKPLVETDTWGNPKGNPTTMVELVIAEVRKYLDETVDRYGRKAYDGKTRSQHYIAEAVSEAIKGEIAEAVNAEKTRAVEAIRAKAAALITEAATKA